MLYVFIGSDTVKAKEKALKLAAGHEVVRFGEGGEPLVNAPGYIGARGIFSSKVALILDRPLETDEGVTLLEAHMKIFASADALVCIIEPNLAAKAYSSVLKNMRMIPGVVVESFDQEEKKDEPAPSVFSLTDAFATGDRKKSWILYRRFIESGVTPEELHGALAWQARAMVLASKTASAAEAGLKPFVFTKAKRAASRLTPKKTEDVSRELVSLYHDARAGKGNLADLLEVFLLQRF